MKKSVVILIAFGTFAAVAWAQSLNLMPIPAQNLNRRAKTFVDAAAQVTDVAVKCIADETKIAGLHAPGSVGVILVGDKNVSEDAVKKAGKEPLPVGLLFLVELNPTSNGQPVSADKLRIVNVKDQQGNDRKLSLMHLAVVSEGADHKLLIYAKGKQPLFTLPLTAVSGTASVALDSKPSEKGALLILTFAGKFQATLPIVPQPL